MRHPAWRNLKEKAIATAMSAWHWKAIGFEMFNCGCVDFAGFDVGHADIDGSRGLGVFDGMSIKANCPGCVEQMLATPDLLDEDAIKHFANHNRFTVDSDKDWCGFWIVGMAKPPSMRYTTHG